MPAQPTSRFAAPSSCSTNSSALRRASSEIAPCDANRGSGIAPAGGAAGLSSSAIVPLSGSLRPRFGLVSHVTLSHKIAIASSSFSSHLAAANCKKPLFHRRFLTFCVAPLCAVAPTPVPAGVRENADGVRMKVKLTDRFCSNIKSASRTDYFDEVTTGLALRVTERGSKSWTYNYTIDGKRARMRLGTYPASAYPPPGPRRLRPVPHLRPEPIH